MSEDLWFTSDTHFGHSSILHLGAGRPFASTEEMDETLILNWNMRVRPRDRVYHLGDFSFHGAAKTERILHRLNGQIHYIRGNHDRVMESMQSRYKFASFGDYKRIKVGDQAIVMFHYPILSWHNAHQGSWHLHGHCHGQLDPSVRNGPILDVGTDLNDYRPFHIDEVAAILADKVWDPVDQHIRKEYTPAQQGGGT